MDLINRLSEKLKGIRDEKAQFRASCQCSTGDASLNNAIHRYIKIGFQDGFDAAIEAIMKDAKIVEIPGMCLGCKFFEIDSSHQSICTAYNKDVLNGYLKPDFCRAKRAIIILEE
jgi:hypothetical protein